MARKYIETSGPIFEPDATKKLKEALSQGIEELGEQGGQMLAGFVRAGGFVNSGRFAGSTVVELHRRNSGAVGWVKVYTENQWPEPDRPTRTWMETGRRSGVKLRRGTYAYRKTAKKLNKVTYDEMFLPRIMEAIG